MSPEFSSYATSAAFNMTMHKNAINEILRLYKHEYEAVRRGKNPAGFGIPIENRSTTSYLLRRGLIRTISKQVNNVPKWSSVVHQLTRPGIFTSKLLIQAGFEYRGPECMQTTEYWDRLYCCGNIKPGIHELQTVVARWGIPRENWREHDTENANILELLIG